VRPGRSLSVSGSMTDENVYDQPSEVDAEKGVVSVKGPDAVDVRLTPDAAASTSDRLLHASMKAQGQRIRKSGVEEAKAAFGSEKPPKP